MTTPTTSGADRIRQVYGARDGSGKRALYAWHRPEVRQQEAHRSRVLASLLLSSLGDDLSDKHMLDVGCGTGGFLRTLVEWGADPTKLVGTEFLRDRLEVAESRSPQTMTWHLGGLDFGREGEFDLVSAHTVFSSILDTDVRQKLAEEMWRMVKPGGWVLVFDFRFDNPANPDVKKVTRRELDAWWPAGDRSYRSLILAPPIARRLTPLSYILSELAAALPFLRSHFLFMARKG